MKNTEKYSIKKSIFIEHGEYEELLEVITDGQYKCEVDYDGITHYNTQSDENSGIEKILSEYFGVNVTSVHIDDWEVIGVWITFTE